MFARVTLECFAAIHTPAGRDGVWHLASVWVVAVLTRGAAVLAHIGAKSPLQFRLAVSRTHPKHAAQTGEAQMVAAVGGVLGDAAGVLETYGAFPVRARVLELKILAQPHVAAETAAHVGIKKTLCCPFATKLKVWARHQLRPWLVGLCGDLARNNTVAVEARTVGRVGVVPQPV